MARTNFAFAKRQRELAKKQKKLEKQARKSAGPDPAAESTDLPPGGPVAVPAEDALKAP